MKKKKKNIIISADLDRLFAQYNVLKANKNKGKNPFKVKDKCCEKYLNGKRCKKCPCFDLI